jgi:hypothetical protein
MPRRLNSKGVDNMTIFVASDRAVLIGIILGVLCQLN